MKKHKDISIVTLSDWHCPHEDKEVVALQIEYCKKNKPDIIVMHELHDFYDVSSYDKNPDRLTNLQHEIDVVNDYMTKLRKACPNSRMILLNSNHLDRLRRYLWTKADGLSGLRALSIPKLLELNKNDIEYMENFTYCDVLFKHGDIVRKFSGYSAHGEMSKEGVSGVSGHTHRGSVYFQTDRAGTRFWIENGCACKINQEYCHGVSNWQHGFSVVKFKDGEVFPFFIPIINGKISNI